MTDWADPAGTGLSIQRKALLAEVAERYYLKQESQQSIADAFEISRSNVSRLLDAARRANVVRFVVSHPLQRHEVLERQLQRTFDVSEAVVVAGSDPQLQLTGSYGGRWLATRSGRLAIGWGRSVEAAVDQVAVLAPRAIEIIQIGGDLSVPPSASGHELTQRLASATGGTPRFLHAPALVESELVASELLADQQVADHLRRARLADAALIGIGRPGDTFDQSTIRDALGDGDQPMANVAARLLDRDGNELDTPLSRRAIALDLEDLRRIPAVTGIAAGAQKGQPIAAALRARLIDTLICDQPAAAAALEA